MYVNLHTTINTISEKCTPDTHEDLLHNKTMGKKKNEKQKKKTTTYNAHIMAAGSQWGGEVRETGVKEVGMYLRGRWAEWRQMI